MFDPNAQMIDPAKCVDPSLRDKVREETLREVLAALPACNEGPLGVSEYEQNLTISECARTIEALLPKPDRAAELVERWIATCGEDDEWDCKIALAFARWLISEGIVL